MTLVLVSAVLYATPVVFGALWLADWLKGRREGSAWRQALRAQNLANRKKHEPRACEARDHEKEI